MVFTVRRKDYNRMVNKMAGFVFLTLNFLDLTTRKYKYSNVIQKCYIMLSRDFISD